MRLPLLLVVLVSVPLGGCSRACGCLEKRPPGPPVDLAAEQASVEALLSGTFSGSVTDVADEADRYAPCALEGEPFTLTMDVAEDATDCVGGDDDGDCTSALEATFPLTASLQIGAGDAWPLDGGALVYSSRSGVDVSAWLAAPPVDLPDQQLVVLISGLALDAASFDGLSWQRQVSEDADASQAWEVCALRSAG